MVGEQRSGQISPTLVLQVMVKPSPFPYHQGLRENDLSTCNLSVDEPGTLAPRISLGNCNPIWNQEEGKEGGQQPLCSPLPIAKMEMIRSKASGAGRAEILFLHRHQAYLV